MAIVSVVAIFAIVLLSQGGLPAVFDGDLTGDAKRALMLKNVLPAFSLIAAANPKDTIGLPLYNSLHLVHAIGDA